MHILPHASAWQLCPLHAMGTYLALLEGPVVDSDGVFDYIHESKAVHFVNSLLKDMHDQWCIIPAEEKPRKFEVYTILLSELTSLKQIQFA